MDQQWLIWLGVALAAGVVEVLTLDLVFLMIAGGALVTAGVAALTGNLLVSVAAFAISTTALLLLARPPLLRYARRVAPTTIGIPALVGRTADVLETVTGADGRVKIGGEVWSARTDREHAVPTGPIEPGSRVRVIRIDGATAVVEPFLPDAAGGGVSYPYGPESES